MNENNHNIETRTKICSGCGEEKSLDEFHRYSRSKDGYFYKCKDCKSVLEKEYRKRKKEGKILKKYTRRNVEYELSLVEKICEQCLEIKQISAFDWRKDNNCYRSECKDCKKEYNKEYNIRPKSKSRRKERDGVNEKKRLESDPVYKLQRTLRRRIRSGINFYSKNGKTKSCKEYGIDFVSIYNKVGPRPGTGKEWHLDHIIPMSVFDLDNELHILLCNSPDNLQWLPANININK
jgi:hypothetical protein